jgi:integrase
MARKATGIYQRGKTWWITYMGIDGQQQWESSGSKLKADADYLLACRKKEIAEGLVPVTSNRKKFKTTFNELAEKYLEYCKPQKDYKGKVSRIKTLIISFGTKKLVDITLEDLEVYQAKRRAEHRQPRKEGGEAGPQLKVATVNRELQVLKNMFTKAEQWGLIPVSSLKIVHKLKLAKLNNARLRFLSIPESNELVHCCKGSLREIVTFALNTGCRRSEIYSLTWEHVDLKHGFIRIVESKNGESRDIPINTDLSAMLEQKKKAQEKKKVRLIKNREPQGTLIHAIPKDASKDNKALQEKIPYVFMNPETGTRYKDVKKSFATSCQKAGIMDFHFHDLRHTFASQLVMAGADLSSVSKLMGHKSLAMTQRYAHLAPDHLKRIVNLLTWNEQSPAEQQAASNS